VPGAYWDPELRAWVLDDEPDPRGAVVACRMFPGIEHDHPILAELRDSMATDAAPRDYAGELGLQVNAPRVTAQMGARGWAWTEDQEVVFGYAAAGPARARRVLPRGLVARPTARRSARAALIDALDHRLERVVVAQQRQGRTSVSASWAATSWPRAAHPWLEVHHPPAGRSAAKRVNCLERAAYLPPRAAIPFALVVHYEALAVIAGTRQGKRTAKSTTLGDGWKKLEASTWDLEGHADEGHRFANPDVAAVDAREGPAYPRRKRHARSAAVRLPESSGRRPTVAAPLPLP
jgi:hypothetical protein